MTSVEPIDVPKLLEILARSDDRDELEQAATAIVASGDRHGLAELGALLAQGELLARLDALDVPSLKTRRLGRVMAAMERHPSAATERISLDLAASPGYLADPDRKAFVLRVLAAVRPMSEEAAALFREANAEGEFGLDAVLLADNGSPRALDLLGEMLVDREVPVARRIDCVRVTVYPHRAEAPMLELAGHLLAADLDDLEATAIAESIFEDDYSRWFPPGAVPPLPSPWEEAPDEALEQVLSLAGPAEKRGALVGPTVERVRGILARRAEERARGTRHPASEDPR
ncbi:hypothetical protein [Sorangium sp. So ce1099]|uniref:hypothetical protein n=1 Tax=Sorangium sp. So ce1099 TaxID=3133331 RepID=UPI003F61E430